MLTAPGGSITPFNLTLASQVSKQNADLQNNIHWLYLRCVIGKVHYYRSYKQFKQHKY